VLSEAAMSAWQSTSAAKAVAANGEGLSNGGGSSAFFVLGSLFVGILAVALFYALTWIYYSNLMVAYRDRLIKSLGMNTNIDDPLTLIQSFKLYRALITNTSGL